MNVHESIRYIRSKTRMRPKIGVVLGSGLGQFGNTLKDPTVIEYANIPHYPRSTVTGHDGRLVLGKLHRHSLLVFQGRSHYYESGDLQKTLYPIRIASRLGIKILFLTNAAGAANREFEPGDLMLVRDQINLTFARPFSGIFEKKKKRSLYDGELRTIVAEAASKLSIPIRQGVYCGIKGPSYETAAEVAMLRRFGADAIGMSTVNEVSLAAKLGIRVAALSCITNLSTGISDTKLTHDEVTMVADQVGEKFTALLALSIESLNPNRI